MCHRYLLFVPFSAVCQPSIATNPTALNSHRGELHNNFNWFSETKPWYACDCCTNMTWWQSLTAYDKKSAEWKQADALRHSSTLCQNVWKRGTTQQKIRTKPSMAATSASRMKRFGELKNTRPSNHATKSKNTAFGPGEDKYPIRNCFGSISSSCGRNFVGTVSLRSLNKSSEYIGIRSPESHAPRFELPRRFHGVGAKREGVVETDTKWKRLNIWIHCPTMSYETIWPEDL